MRLFLLLIIFNFSYATVIKDIYKQKLLATSQSAKERETLFHDALENVLVKVSGTQGVLKSFSHKKKENFVQSYSYKNEDGNLFLHIQFNPNKINSALHKLKQPVWDKDRPLILLWLASDVSSIPQDELLDKIDLLSKKRGLPVLLPLMDMADSNIVSAQDIWHLAPDKLKQGSERYGADVVLAGRITESHGNCHGKWRLIYSDTVTTWNAVGQKLDVMLESMVDDLSLKLMQHYAVWSDAENKNEIVLHISGVNSFNQYIKALDYLNSINIINQILIKEINEQEMTISLDLNGEINALIQALNVGKTLKKEKEAINNRIFYRV